jgi:hypothetical protein
LLLGVSPYLAFGAFIAAVAAVMVAERHLRVIGDEAMQRVTNLRRNAAGSRPDSDR